MAPEIGYKPMQALLKKTRDFTAIFCFNDIAAIGAIRALKDAGLSVPGDVSVVGFDDIQSAAYSTPSLTTVRQPLTEMGKRGAQVLLERIANREKQFPAEIVMAPELVVRESTGPAPQRLSSSRQGLKPAADVHLSMRLAAIVPRVGASAASSSTCNRQLRAVAVHHKPVHGLVALLPQISHRKLCRSRHDLQIAHLPISLFPATPASADPALFSRQSMCGCASARFIADALHGSTVTTNGSACCG